ncbi:MAG: glycosyltransferase [Candidatus Omnitrophota bacterium]
MRDNFIESIRSRSLKPPILKGKRIIIVQPSLGMGGSERQGLMLALYLKQEIGMEVEFWGFNFVGQIAQLCERYGIPWKVISINPRRKNFDMIRNLVKMALLLRRAHPDVILPYTALPNILCNLVWRLTGAQLCIWNQRDAGISLCGGISQRLSVRMASLFVCNSEHLRGFLFRALNVDQKCICLIPNGVEPCPSETDRAAWRRQLGVDDNCFLACMLANLSIRKDHATLLKAWRLVLDQLHKMNRQAVLLLAGMDQGTKKMLKALAFDLGLGGNIRFLGTVKDIYGLFSASNIGVFSLKSEGCSNGVLECMASGLPVVATDIPGIREIMGPKNYFLLSQPENAKNFAEQILKLASDPCLCNRLGSINRERIAIRFSAQDMYDKMTDLISQKLIPKAGAGREKWVH